MQTFEKNYKNYKLLGTDSMIKKNYDFISIITLYCINVVIFCVFVTRYHIVI